MIRRIVLLIGMIAMTIVNGWAAQSSYPTKAITLVVAFAPGGGSDVVARIMAKYLSIEMGVPVNVVNKGGGNQIPAVLSVLSAAPDGYTLLQELPANSSLHALLKTVPYSIENRTFGPIMVEGFQAYVVNGKSPWNSLQDVATAAKKDPGSFTWGRLGGTSITDLTNLQFFEAAGIDASKTKPVSFDGSGPVITAVAGGHILFGNGSVAGVFPLMRSGDIKVLALTGDKRVSTLPQIPTVKEAGFPKVDIRPWFGLSGPQNIPKEVLETLDRAAKKVVENPGFIKEIEAVANRPWYATPEQARQLVMNEIKNFKGLISGIK